MSVKTLFRKKSFRIITLFVLLIGVGAAFAVDSDNDGMSDLYEAFFKLNPFDGSDAVLHDDSDELNNLAESERWTDPFSPDTDMDGWADDVDSNALSRAVFMWGHPDFVDGDSYSYTGPAWMAGAVKNGGTWTPDAWVVASNEVAASLIISVDRTDLNANCVMDMWFEDTVDSSVQIQLLNADNSIAVTNLVADLTDDTESQQFKRVAVPFVSYPSVSKISVNVLQADNGFTLYSSTLYIDEDADGLDADQEAQLGTSDQIADTDEDGLSDFEEAMITGTDPLDADADGDGLLDADEIENETDPATADTDGDGLSDWFELVGFRYHVVNNALTWDAAKVAAEVCGGHLAVISSQEEHDLMIEIAGKESFHNCNIWFGASDAEEEGVWKWIDGSAVTFDLWDKVGIWEAPQPDNLYNSEHHAAYSCWDLDLDPVATDFSAMVWVDICAQGQFGYLVERDIPMDPNNPDMDDDGLNDGLEIELGTNPWSRESDGDGLLDYVEYTGATDPAKADTDGDGLSDSEEMEAGTDPVIVDSDGDSLSDWYELVGCKYQVVTNNKVGWFEAKAAAEAGGGHLATIKSQEEHDLMVSMVGLEIFYNRNLWIGASDAEEEGVWKWIDGDPVEFNLWDPQEFDPNKGEMEDWASYGCWWAGAEIPPLSWSDRYSKVGWNYIIERETAMDPLNPDMDGDGLNDGLEIELGSNPWSAESDGDGILDIDEYNGTTHPGRADSDADGLTDDEEPLLGLDPTNPDEDGDGLTDGYELLLSKYELIIDSSSLEEARAAAGLRGGELVSITSSDEHALVLESVDPLKVAAFDPWIGASYDPASASWSWESGEEWGYELWDVRDHTFTPSEPAWVYYAWSREWRTSVDDHYNGFIVEYPQNLDPFNPDSDGDGVLDGDEIEQGSSPYVSDTDGDGLDDLSEINTGLNPKSADSDCDGIDDAAETVSATDALNPDTDGDGLLDGEEAGITLTDPLLPDSDGNGTPDASLVCSVDGVDTTRRFTGIYWNTWSEEGTSLVLHRLVNRRALVNYNINASEEGMYQLAVDTSWLDEPVVKGCETRIEIYIDGKYVSKISPVYTPDGTLKYSCITPWLVAGRHDVQLVIYAAASVQEEIVKIDRVGLYGIDGADLDGNGIPDWMENRMGEDVDTDGDGLPDFDEVTVHGTDPLSVDTDGDGLSDADELLLYFTNPLLADTDNDGVDDGTEILQALTDPLLDGFGTQSTLVSLPGSDGVVIKGTWMTEGDSIYSAGLNGTLEYQVDVADGGHYSVAFDIKDRKANPYGAWFDLTLYVDGICCGRVERNVDAGTVEAVVFFLPYLEGGTHSVVLEWNNLNPEQGLEVLGMSLIAYEGNDADGNGQADWIDSRSANSFGLDEQSVGSFVSPVCIEGEGLFADLVSIDGAFELAGQSNQAVAVSRSLGLGWYADARLSPAEETVLTVSHNHGASSEELAVKWEETNLMNLSTNAVTIRSGGALLFSAVPENGSDGSMLITIEGLEGTTNIASFSETPVPFTFDEPGEYILGGCFSGSRALIFNTDESVNEYGFRSGIPQNGLFDSGTSVSVEGALVVNVVDYRFNGNPVCLEGVSRNWNCPDIFPDTVVEADAEVAIDAVFQDESGTDFRLSTVSRSERRVVARLFEEGPVCDSAAVSMLLQGSMDYYRILQEFPDGSKLVEITMMFENLPPDAEIVISAKTSGVTFLDGSVEMVITAADLDENGMIKVLMVQSDDKLAVCHYVEIFQNGELLIKR